MRRVVKTLQMVVVPITLVLLLTGFLTPAISLVKVSPVYAAGTLDVTIIAGYNLVVDSNVTSPSTYAPSVATVIGRFCNTGTDPLTDVFGYIGNGTTPGTYPSWDSTGDSGPLGNSGSYAFRHLGGAEDASRPIGDLAPDECKVQYWHFEYPQCENNGGSWENPPCTNSPTWGDSVKPDDDLSLSFVIWGTSAEASTDSATWTMTMRNEISAMANKIKPNPDGEWFNTDTDQVVPGEPITTNGINYELGNVRFGFDNDGNFAPDYNAWLQPFGNPDFDPSCFRLIHTEGTITVTRGAGLEDLIIDFDDHDDPDPVYGGPLYFTNLPDDNTGVRGVVYYTFQALRGPCSSGLSPYQEVASGYDNEKFNGDYGAGIPPVGSSEAEVTIDKTGPNSTSTGTTFTYNIPFANQSETKTAGLTLSSGGAADAPLVVEDTVPDGLAYKCGTAAVTGFDYTPNPAPGYKALYSNDSGSTWSSDETDIGCPADPTSDSMSGQAVMLQWWLTEPLPTKGASGNNGAATATFDAYIPGTYSEPFIENCAKGKFGNGKEFAEACKVTLVEGDNSIGDYVWRDENRNGVKDDGDTGISNVTVSLYWDQGTSGVLDDEDILITTQDTSGATEGNYSFLQLPNGDYLVQVSTDDPDISVGYYPTTVTLYAVSLTGGTEYEDADFGFGPSLSFDKQLISGDPAYEGDDVIFHIDITNNRSGDGNPPGPCQYTVWGTTYFNDTANNKAWTNPANIVPAPDGLYATAPFANAGENISVSTWDLGSSPAETIQKVEVLVPMLVYPTLAGSLNVQMIDTANHDHVYDVATLADGTLAVDVTADRTWAWSDFTSGATTTSVKLIATKSGNPSGQLDVDAVGYRITTNATCGDPSDTINLLPLTDTFDNTKLQYVSSRPPATVSGGTITWNNVGPIYAGQTKEIIVRFRALEPPDSDDPTDGEPDPTTHENCASTSGGQFADGALVNDADDCVIHNINPGGTIGDWIWADNDNSGGATMTAGDLGLRNVTVHLWDCGATCENGAGDDVMIKTTTTDYTGWYLFTGVPDNNGYYQVIVDTSTLPGGATGWTCNYDDATPFDSRSGPITIDYDDGSSTNDDYLNADFSYRYSQQWIVGTIWHDRNNSQTPPPPDTGEEWLAGVNVNVCSNSNCQSGCTNLTTDANGYFATTRNQAGTYYICVQSTTGPLGTGTWSQTWDTDGTGTAHRVTVNVLAGGYARGDFSYRRTDTILLGDTIYTDWNGDGTQDTGEEGINNVTVNLYLDDGDGVYEPDQDTFWQTTTTNASGWYNFTVTPGGDYLVVIDQTTLPSGYAQTQDPDETGVCVTCNSLSDLQNLAASDLNQDFGYRPMGTGSIGDRVWQDTNGNGIQNTGEPGIADITVNLYEDSNNDGIIDSGDALVATTSTDADGLYLFTNLPAGNYLVDVDTTDPQLPTDGYSNRYVLSTNNDPHDVTLASGQAYLLADFGFTAGGTIGDYVWQDNDGDGIQDDGEPGIDGVTVELRYTGCTPGSDCPTDVTSGGGLYLFTSLPAGDYTVAIISGLPSGFTQSGDPDRTKACSAGGTPACDNASSLSLAAGRIDLSRDFGYIPPGVIGDWVWLDANKDGVQDPGESGIGYVTMYLCASASPCDSDNNLAETATDSDGYYSFGNLSDGTYYVAVEASTLPADVAITYDLDNGTSSPNGITAVSLSGGGSNLTADFGYFYDGDYSISGTVFWDSGNNGGLYTPPSDLPYEGVTVYLYNSSGQLIASMTSASDGSYLFDNLPSGDYTVSVNRYSEPLGGASPTAPAPDPYRTPVTIVNQDVIEQDFGFYKEAPPTAVTLVAFTATPQGSTILLSWETATELDNLGFNLYRAESPDGQRSQLNDSLIPSQNPGSPVGGIYQFVDESVQAGVAYYYWLEAVDVYGAAALYGPVSAQVFTDSRNLYHVFMPVIHK